MRGYRAGFFGIAALLVVAQAGCTARNVRVPAVGRPAVDEVDRKLCDQAARAEADGIVGADPGEGAMRAMVAALHPGVVVMTGGASLFVAPFAVVPFAVAKGFEDRRLRAQAYTRTLSACLDVVAAEQKLGLDDPAGVERARFLAGRYLSLAASSAAAHARNAGLAGIPPVTPEPVLQRFDGTPLDPGRPTGVAMGYAAWAERDGAAAQSLYRRALTVQEGRLGPDHPDVADTLAAHAAFLRRVDQGAEAAVLEERAAAIRAAHLPETEMGTPNAPSIAPSL